MKKILMWCLPYLIIFVGCFISAFCDTNHIIENHAYIWLGGAITGLISGAIIGYLEMKD